MTTLDSETCDRLQKRLRDAEAGVRKALKDSDKESPLHTATEELIDAHRDIRKLLQQAEDTKQPASDADSKDVVKAEIEIGREEHEMKPDAKDVLKAIFMWKDDPQERANGG